jgi:hypothetical protein
MQLCRMLWSYCRIFKNTSEQASQIFFTSADKKRLLTEYIWAGDLWGTLDPLTGQWNGIVHQVSLYNTSTVGNIAFLTL